MRMALMGLVLMGMGAFVGGCVSDERTVHTPADTQPRPYIDTVTNPQNQPQLDRTGTVVR